MRRNTLGRTGQVGRYWRRSMGLGGAYPNGKWSETLEQPRNRRSYPTFKKSPLIHPFFDSLPSLHSVTPTKSKPNGGSADPLERGGPGLEGSGHWRALQSATGLLSDSTWYHGGRTPRSLSGRWACVVEMPEPSRLLFVSFLDVRLWSGVAVRHVRAFGAEAFAY